jgi:hypothetical protein
MIKKPVAFRRGLGYRLGHGDPATPVPVVPSAVPFGPPLARVLFRALSAEVVAPRAARGGGWARGLGGMTPAEAVAYLVGAYGHRALPTAMAALYVGAFQPLDRAACERCAVAIAEGHQKLPSVAVVKTMVRQFQSVGARQDSGPRTAEQDWLATPVLDGALRQEHMREALALCRQIITASVTPAERVEAFRRLHAKYPRCGWDDAAAATAALYAD